MAQEFSFNIDNAALSRGLRPDQRISESEFWAEVMTNLKPTPMGLVPPTLITDPVVTPTTTLDWPHPQLLKGERIFILAFAQSIYLMNTSAWTGILSTPKRITDTGTNFTISDGQIWELVPFMDNLYLCNANDLLISVAGIPDSNTFVGVDATYGLVTTTTISKDTAQQRLVLGGLAGSYFTNAEWTGTLFPRWQRSINQRSDVVTDDQAAFGKHYVLWSEPAGGADDVPFNLFMGYLGLPDATAYAKVQELVLQAIDRRKIGMMPIRTQGSVLKVKELGQNQVVYTSVDVHLMIPDGDYYTQQKILDVGVKLRNCVGGDEQEHVFIDSEDNLWRLRADQAPQRLRYNEFMDDLTAVDIVITLDPLERDFWIGDGSNAFILTDSEDPQTGRRVTGLCKTTRSTTGVVRAPGTGLIGISSEISTEETFEVRINLGDIGGRDFKIGKSIDVLSRDLSSVTGGFDYRYNDTDTWTQVPSLANANDQGVIFSKANAIHLRVIVKGTWDNVNSKLERLTVHYQNAGRRFHRGARGTVGQSQR